MNITNNRLDNNFLFYLLIKELNGTNGLSDQQLVKTHEVIRRTRIPWNVKMGILKTEYGKIKKDERRENLLALIEQINREDFFYLFTFSVKLIFIKSYLLQTAKMIDFSRRIEDSGYHPLSLSADTISKSKPYYIRVHGALLALLFFKEVGKGNSMILSEPQKDFIQSIIDDYLKIMNLEIEPNQIFMLMFSESVNQSIKSLAGSTYEDIIYNELLSFGIASSSISKIHDKADSSTEFDFFFELGGKTIGIGAKRTLRERYKQFIKTAQMTDIDIMIQITLGLDLTEEKAKAIRKHDVYMFIANEIYESRGYLKDMEGIFPVSEFNLKTLQEL